VVVLGLMVVVVVVVVVVLGPVVVLHVLVILAILYWTIFGHEIILKLSTFTESPEPKEIH